MKTKNSVLRLLEGSPEAAYWVGLFFADGSINEKAIKFYLGSKDAEHARRFRDWLDPGLTFHGTGFKLQDIDQTQAIAERFDLRPRKTYNPPARLPYDDDILLRAWLVGLIDGDGSIVFQHGRKDVTISTVSHKSWEPLVSKAAQQLSFGYVHVADYVRWISHRMLDNIALKQFALEHELPVMARKWDRVDTDYKTRALPLGDLAPKIKEMLRNGQSVREIEATLKCSGGYVYRVRSTMIQ